MSGGQSQSVMNSAKKIVGSGKFLGMSASKTMAGQRTIQHSRKISLDSDNNEMF
jgi:hypothetical protein